MDWPFNETARTRFFAKVKRGYPNECWPWTARLTDDGYGQFRAGGKGSPNMPAHRAAWAFAHAEMPPDGLSICHRCDYPACCNPAHLWIGTTAENIADRDAKGRGVSGERHPNFGKNWGVVKPEQRARGTRQAAAKLTDADVREMRRLYDAKEATQVELARQFGVAQPTVSKVVRRVGWAHVD